MLVGALGTTIPDQNCHV